MKHNYDLTVSLLFKEPKGNMCFLEKEECSIVAYTPNQAQSVISLEDNSTK